MAAEHEDTAATLSGTWLPHGALAESEGVEMIEAIARWWCRNFHKQITRPLHGEYGCLKCLRMYEAGYR